MAIRVLLAGLALAGAVSAVSTARAAAPPPRPDPRQVAVECRLVTVTDAGLKRLAVGQDGMRMALLDEAAVRRLLEAVQADPAANVMQAPVAQARVGQQVIVAVGQKCQFVTGVDWVTLGQTKTPRPRQETREVGVRIDLKSGIGDEGRFIRAGVGLQYSFLNPEVPDTFPICWAVHPADMGRRGEQPVVLTQHIQQPKVCTFKLDTTVDVPAGQTAVFTGWAYDREIKREVALSALAYLPGVGPLLRLQQRVKRTEHLLVLITPRVVQPESAPAAP